MGILREESAFMPESCCRGITQHMVTAPEDIDVLLYILEHRKLSPSNLDDYRSRAEMWKPYDGMPCPVLPCQDPLYLHSVMSGSE
ncbi:MAG: hypothetical protein KAS17_05630 [Victivallaceae bacterium]|nr:hypothetical protein [Victivallaceae bacterium]